MIAVTIGNIKGIGIGIGIGIIIDFWKKNKINIFVLFTNYRLIKNYLSKDNTIRNEEKKYIFPIIKKLKNIKIYIDGPISGDAMISDKNVKKYNSFIFNYNDQVLISFKIFRNYEVINYTGRLIFFRISPDHRTTYDLVGRNISNNKSILKCFNFLKK